MTAGDEEELIDGNKVRDGRLALVKALIKVMKHYDLNAAELAYAHHESLMCLGVDQPDEAALKAFGTNVEEVQKEWFLFIVHSFREVMTRETTRPPGVATH